MSEVILEKSNNQGSSENEPRNNRHRIPYVRNGAEISLQSELLKRRVCLVTHPGTNQKNAHRPKALFRPEDLATFCLIENKKAAVLEKLEHAIEKLKDARLEIHEALLAALEMKEAGDDIADQIMVELAAICHY
jgi:hypothetical protein